MGTLIAIGVVILAAIACFAQGYYGQKNAQAAPAEEDEGGVKPSSMFGADVGPASVYRDLPGAGVYREQD